MSRVQSHPEGEVNKKSRYEAPAIIYEGVITTRAGSVINSIFNPDERQVDPGDLFGNGDGRG